MIDPNEAPEGCRAEIPEPYKWLKGTCLGCDLRGAPECMDASCTPNKRADGSHVIFKRIGPVMAVYSTPCDDMGAHVADDEVTA